MCRQAAGLIARDEEKRLLLGTLGNIESPEAVELIVPYVDDAGSPAGGGAGRRDGGRESCFVDAAPRRSPRKLIPSLEKVAQAASDEKLANRAKAVLQQAQNKAGASSPCESRHTQRVASRHSW